MITFGAAFKPGGIENLTTVLLQGANPTMRNGAHFLRDQGPIRIAEKAASIYSKRAAGRSRSKSLLDPSSYIARARALGGYLGYEVRFSVGLSDDLFQAKFFTLNNGGASGYLITPHNPPRFLSFPYPTEGSAHITRRQVWWTQRGGKHGTHFFEDGIEEAITDAMSWFG